MASPTHKFLITVAGPTASGKTSLAILLARHFKTEILSGDSRQFYKELSIGTAKPTREEQAQAKHHFIDSLHLGTDYSAGDFERDGLHVLEQIYRQNHLAILCGGSGLFIKALCEGLDKLPVKDDAIRKNIIHQYETKGLPWLQEEVNRLDPDYALQADMQNPNRLMRALEVCLVTGKPYSSLRINQAAPRNFQVIPIGLDMPREILYNRINNRVEAMVQAGLEQEAKSVYAHRNSTALKTVGYTELFDFFDGKLTREQAIEKIKQHSRNYAKKQLTWFRKQPGISWFHPDETEKIIMHISHQINTFANSPINS